MQRKKKKKKVRAKSYMKKLSWKISGIMQYSQGHGVFMSRKWFFYPPLVYKVYYFNAMLCFADFFLNSVRNFY